MPILESVKLSTAELTGFLLYLLFVSTLGPLLFGYHLAELNAPSEVITCARKSIGRATKSSLLPQCIPMTTLQLGLVSSTYTLGGLVGALAAGPLSSKYGRLLPMRMLTFVALCGAVAEALAPSIALMAFGRVVSGIAAGASTVIVPLYVSPLHSCSNTKSNTRTDQRDSPSY